MATKHCVFAKHIRESFKKTMLIIGLTGSVATGKTTIASLLSKMRIPVFNSDEAVSFILDQDKKIIHQIR